jgi:hypothetical protein
MCFSPDIKACTHQMMQTGELFTMQMKHQQPKVTVDEVSEHLYEVDHHSSKKARMDGTDHGV